MRTITRFTTLAGLALCATVPHAATAQQVVQQKMLDVEDVIGPNAKPSKTEKEEAKERKRHNQALEKEVRKLGKGNAFAMGAGRGRQTSETRQISPDSTQY